LPSLRSPYLQGRLCLQMRWDIIATTIVTITGANFL
jgi:hypothetical protein